MTASVHQTENLLFAVLLQLIVMIAAARVMNTAFRRLYQPGVIGEILAGLLLGPSLVGHFFPTFSHTLFGKHASPTITIISQVGRILRQYDLTRTEIGVVAISSAALNDIIGWVLLAGISAYAAAQFSGAQMALQIGGLLLFVLVLAFVLRPCARWLVQRFPLESGDIAPNLLALVLCLVFLLGMCTYKLGIFAIFGGFAAGLLFHPYEAFVAAWQRQVGRFVMVFFLPVFFTYTGLRTNVLGLTTLGDLQWLAVFLAASILGKIIPVYCAARLTGFAHYEATILGSLMNTRALMELIVLNIGYDLGFIPRKVFTMLVIMAVVTTIMTGPLLKRLLPKIGHPIPQGIEA